LQPGLAKIPKQKEKKTTRLSNSFLLNPERGINPVTKNALRTWAKKKVRKEEIRATRSKGTTRPQREIAEILGPLPKRRGGLEGIPPRGKVKPVSRGTCRTPPPTDTDAFLIGRAEPALQRAPESRKKDWQKNAGGRCWGGKRKRLRKRTGPARKGGSLRNKYDPTIRES